MNNFPGMHLDFRGTISEYFRSFDWT